MQFAGLALGLVGYRHAALSVQLLDLFAPIIFVYFITNPRTTVYVAKISEGMASQRNRPRGPNRNSEAGHGEEVQIYQDAINRLRACLDSFNESSDNVLDIRDQTKEMSELKAKGGKKVPEVQTYNSF